MNLIYAWLVSLVQSGIPVIRVRDNGIQKTSVNKPTLGQPFLGLLSGLAYYAGEFYVVLFNKMSREKLGLLSDWAYYPGAY